MGNPEQKSKITALQERAMVAASSIKNRVESQVDIMHNVNVVAGAINKEQPITLVIAATVTAAAIIFDTKREKIQQEKYDEQTKAERKFWGSFEREVAKTGEQRSREQYKDIIKPHVDEKFSYIKPEDTKQSKILMKETEKRISEHPNVTDIGSSVYIVGTKDNPSPKVCLRIMPSESGKKNYELTYLQLNSKDDPAQPRSIDQRIIWYDNGSSIQAYEKQKWIDGKVTKSRKLSIEELTEFQQKILSHLPPRTYT